jgi:hypothetical protein
MSDPPSTTYATRANWVAAPSIRVATLLFAFGGIWLLSPPAISDATTTKTTYERVTVTEAGLSLLVPASWTQSPSGSPDPGGLGPSVFFAWDRSARGFGPNVQVRTPTGTLPEATAQYRRLPWVEHPGKRYRLQALEIDGHLAYRDDVRYGGLHRSTLAVQVAADHISTVQVQTKDNRSGRRTAKVILRSVTLLPQA